MQRFILSLGRAFRLRIPSPKQVREANDQVLQALAHYHDRAFGFVYLSGKHPDASLRELDRCVRDGPMVGVKLWVARRADEAELDALIRRAAEAEGPDPPAHMVQGEGQPAGERPRPRPGGAAKRHPKASFICGHTGGDWPLGIRAIRTARTSSTETAGFDPTTGVVEMAVREVGAERVVYGKRRRGAVVRVAVPRQGPRGGRPGGGERLILTENLHRLLTPILKAKGYRV